MKYRLRKQIAFFLAAVLLCLMTVSAFGADPDWDSEEIQLIFYGDSRTQGLAMCAGGCVYVGKVAVGYSWMAGSGYSLLQDAMVSYPQANVVFCFGVNDLGNVDSYIQFFRDFQAAYPERNAYFASVNPIADEYAAANGYVVKNASVEAFNARVQEQLPDDYIDTYTFLAAGGYDTVDGVHYGSETYVEIQNLTMLLVAAKQMEDEFKE